MVVKIQCNVIGDNTQHDDWHIKRLTFISLLCNGANILDPKKKKKKEHKVIYVHSGHNKTNSQRASLQPSIVRNTLVGTL